MTTAILTWTNWEQPDEGHDWTSSASFLTEGEARRAAIALTSETVHAAWRATVQVYEDQKVIARYEYADGAENLIFDDRVPPLFTLHGKLGGAP